MRVDTGTQIGIRLSPELLIATAERIPARRQRISAKLIRAIPIIRVARGPIVRVAIPVLAPAQRPAWVSALVRLGGVQERILVFFLVAAALGVSVVVV